MLNELIDEPVNSTQNNKPQTVNPLTPVQIPIDSGNLKNLQGLQRNEQSLPGNNKIPELTQNHQDKWGVFDALKEVNQKQVPKPFPQEKVERTQVI